MKPHEHGHCCLCFYCHPCLWTATRINHLVLFICARASLVCISKLPPTNSEIPHSQIHHSNDPKTSSYFSVLVFFLIDTHDTRKLKEEMCALAHNFRRTSVRHVRESKAACKVLCLCMEILLSNCLHAMDRNQRNRADPAMSKNFKGTVN